MTRLVSGLALAAAALAAILLLPTTVLRIVAAGVAALAAHEYVHVAGTGRGASQWIVVVAVVAACWWIAAGLPIDPVYLLVIALAWVAFEVLFLGRSMHQAGASVVGPIYIGMPLGMLVAIQSGVGAAGTLLLLATVVVSDSGQYYSGRMFGRRPLAPSISPKKTIEGAVGGILLGTAFFAMASRYALPVIHLPQSLLLGFAIVVLGICGDLFESRLKRTAGLKDSSALIPGHGGVLDRMDALLFAIPGFYLFLRAAP